MVRRWTLVWAVALTLAVATAGCGKEEQVEEPPASAGEEDEPAGEQAAAPEEEAERADEAVEEKPAEEAAEEPEQAEEGPAAEGEATDEAERHPGLLDPSKATEEAPEQYRVTFDTTAGPFTVEVHREWAPKAADRFWNLVEVGYYDGVALFRIVEGFMAQFGIHGDPEINKAWRAARIEDDARNPDVSNERGTVTFASAGPDTRTTQIFINFANNARLDAMGFTPFGEVVEGMDNVDSIYAGYGEGQPRGKGPDQGRLQQEGNAYLKEEYPKLDYIETARVESKETE
ncbi:MAG: peptidylprolyl isomerase [Myxococcota bacterium]